MLVGERRKRACSGSPSHSSRAMRSWSRSSRTMGDTFLRNGLSARFQVASREGSRVPWRMTGHRGQLRPAAPQTSGEPEHRQHEAPDINLRAVHMPQMNAPAQQIQHHTLHAPHTDQPRPHRNASARLAPTDGSLRGLAAADAGLRDGVAGGCLVTPLQLPLRVFYQVELHVAEGGRQAPFGLVHVDRMSALARPRRYTRCISIPARIHTMHTHPRRAAQPQISTARRWVRARTGGKAASARRRHTSSIRHNPAFDVRFSQIHTRSQE